MGNCMSDNRRRIDPLYMYGPYNHFMPRQPQTARKKAKPVNTETNTSRYLLPPQKPLYKNSLTVVLDLDETLVNGHDAMFPTLEEQPGIDTTVDTSTVPGSTVPASTVPTKPKYKDISGRDYNVYIRPYVLELFYMLRKLNIEIVIWSAGTAAYVLSTLYYMLMGELNIIDHIIWRDDRWHPAKAKYPVPKYLNMLGRDLRRVLFIDNLPSNTIINPHNSICIDDFNNAYMLNRLDPQVSTELNPTLDNIDSGECNEKLTTDTALLGLIILIAEIDYKVKSMGYDVPTILSSISNRANTLIMTQKRTIRTVREEQNICDECLKCTVDNCSDCAECECKDNTICISELQEIVWHYVLKEYSKARVYREFPLTPQDYIEIAHRYGIFTPSKIHTFVAPSRSNLIISLEQIRRDFY